MLTQIVRLRDFFNRYAAWAILIATYVYVFGFVLTRQNSWVEPEMWDPERIFLAKKIPLFSLDWWKEGFNYPLFEYAPRPFRPLSSFMEMLDFDLRANLWRYMLPHPGLSLTWIFTFILSPILMYKLLRRMQGSREFSLIGIAIYLSSMGCLSVSAVFFRPGKAMVNFFILLCLYLASRLADSERKPHKFEVPLLWICVAITFFWDETGVLAFPAVLLLYPQVVFKSWKRIAAFATLPFVALLGYVLVIPWITEMAGFPWPDLFNYPQVQNIVAHEYDHDFFLVRLAQFLAIAFAECFGLTYPWLINSTGALILQILTEVAVVIFLAACAYYAWTRRSWTSLNTRLLIAILALCIFDVFLLGTTNNGVWGLFYYGIYISLAFALFLGTLFTSFERRWSFSKNWLMIFASLVIASSFYIFEHVNFAYKSAFYPVRPGHADRLRAIFFNDINIFALKEESEVLDLAGHTRRFQECMMTKTVCEKPLLELYYLPIELTEY